MIQKLSALEPAWISDGPRVLGLRFRCPACVDQDRGKGRAHMVVVYFTNPPGGATPLSPGALNADQRRYRVGTTFDDMTLSPAFDEICWRGEIKDGQVRSDRMGPVVVV